MAAWLEAFKCLKQCHCPGCMAGAFKMFKWTQDTAFYSSGFVVCNILEESRLTSEIVRTNMANMCANQTEHKEVNKQFWRRSLACSLVYCEIL